MGTDKVLNTHTNFYLLAPLIDMEVGQQKEDTTPWKQQGKHPAGSPGTHQQEQQVRYQISAIHSFDEECHCHSRPLKLEIVVHPNQTPYDETINKDDRPFKTVKPLVCHFQLRRQLNDWEYHKHTQSQTLRSVWLPMPLFD